MRSVLFYKPDAGEMRRRPLSFWVGAGLLPVLLGLLVVRFESSDLFTFTQTSHWTRPFWESLTGDIDDQSWHTKHLLMRKAGHVLGYGTLTLILMRSWLMVLAFFDRAGRMRLPAWRWRACALAVLSTMLIGASDEYHQTLLLDRTGRASDVAIDAAGGVLFCLLFWAFCWRPRRWEREL